MACGLWSHEVCSAGFEACMAYCSDDDECDAAETDDEVEVRLSGLRYGSRDSGEVGGGQLRGRAV